MAQRVQQGEARCRLLTHSLAGAGFTAPLREVVLQGVTESRETLEKNDLLLLAESLYFATCLCRSVSRDEVRALLAALAPLAGVVASPAMAHGEQLAAHAVLFATLAALERGKVAEEDVPAILSDEFFRTPERDSMRAALRLALALTPHKGGDTLIKSACDDGVFAFLLSIVQHQALLFVALVRRRLLCV